MPLLGRYNPISSNPEKVTAAKLQNELGSSKIIAYPSVEAPHFMHITVVEYQRTSPSTDRYSPPKDSLQRQFILPLPAELQDNYQVNYSTAEMGAFGGALGELQNVMEGKDVADALGDSLGGAYSTLKEKLRGIAGAGGAAAAEKLFGTAANPHLTQVFDGVGLKNYTFSWNVYPQTPDESERLRRVLSQIKMVMHPLKANEFMLEYPFECYASFYISNKFLFEVGRSVISGLSINYAPQGASFFKGTHAPTNIQFSLNLTEVAALTANDIAERDGTLVDLFLERKERSILAQGQLENNAERYIENVDKRQSAAFNASQGD